MARKTKPAAEPLQPLKGDTVFLCHSVSLLGERCGPQLLHLRFPVTIHIHGEHTSRWVAICAVCQARWQNHKYQPSYLMSDVVVDSAEYGGAGFIWTKHLKANI